MSGKVLRTEETWEILEDALDEMIANALDAEPRPLIEVDQVAALPVDRVRYETALRFHSWPHEIPAPKPNDRSTKEGPCPTRE